MLLPDKDNIAKQLYIISKLSQSQLADLIPISPSRLRLWLIGKEPPPHRQQRIRELLREFQKKKEAPNE